MPHQSSSFDPRNRAENRYAATNLGPFLGRARLTSAGEADRVPTPSDAGVPGPLVSVAAAVDVVLNLRFDDRFVLDIPCRLCALHLAGERVMRALGERHVVVTSAGDGRGAQGAGRGQGACGSRP